MPKANTEAMQYPLEERSIAVEKGCHALIIVDGAAWHSTPKLLIPSNISLLALPPYSPELNPVEQIGQQRRKSHFSNRCFKGYEEIVEVCCQAWSAFTEMPDVIQSLCSRKWAMLE